MPALSNPKHERFAQELAKGTTGEEAYVLAGFARSRPNAGKLRHKDYIVRRLGEIASEQTGIRARAAEKAAERLSVSVESLIGEAEEVRLAAMAAGQFAPAISAIKEKGILAGVRVEKRENTNRSLVDVSDDELARIAFPGGEGASSEAVGSTLTH